MNINKPELKKALLDFVRQPSVSNVPPLIKNDIVKIRPVKKDK